MFNMHWSLKSLDQGVARWSERTTDIKIETVPMPVVTGLDRKNNKH